LSSFSWAISALSQKKQDLKFNDDPKRSDEVIMLMATFG